MCQVATRYLSHVEQVAEDFVMSIVFFFLNLTSLPSSSFSCNWINGADCIYPFQQFRAADVRAYMHRKLSQNTRDCYFWLLNIGAERTASNPTAGFSEKMQVRHHRCGFSAFRTTFIGCCCESDLRCRFPMRLQWEMKIFCLLREYKVKLRRMWVRLTLELLHPVLITRASAIRIDRHFQNVLVTYSHGNLNVHNLDCI